MDSRIRVTIITVSLVTLTRDSHAYCTFWIKKCTIMPCLNARSRLLCRRGCVSAGSVTDALLLRNKHQRYDRTQVVPSFPIYTCNMPPSKKLYKVHD
jgi:hypothetical protein